MPNILEHKKLKSKSQRPTPYQKHSQGPNKRRKQDFKHILKDPSLPSASDDETTFKQSVVQQKYSSDTALCAFCGLPANKILNLGDLYGPFRPSFQDVVDRYDAACKKVGPISEKLFNFSTTLKTSEPEVQFKDDTCYITRNSQHSSPEKTSDTDIPSTDSTSKSIGNVYKHLKLLHILDNILLESDKKRRSSNTFRKFHIPGVTGGVKFSSDSKVLSTEQQKIPKINLIVFNEPTVEINHTTKNKDLKLNSHPAAGLRGDFSSIQVCHSFNTSQIWVHAQCAVWTPNVNYVGGQLFGLFEAVREAATKHCSVCKRIGASISCYHHRNKIYHYPCAVMAKLPLNHNTLMVNV